MRTLTYILVRLEHVKLRTVFFTFATSFIGLIFTSTLLLTSRLEYSSNFSPYAKLRRLLAKPEHKNIVIIYSQRRSGTTFMGKIFSEKPKSFYLFEPLMPFTTECDILREARMSTLTEILQCDFSRVTSDFTKALKITGYPDDYAKCLKNTLCFSNKNGHLLEDYGELCQLRHNVTQKKLFDPDSEKCGYPLRPSILTDICEFSSIVAVKIVRICSLQMMENLYSVLTEKGKRVFILHLVRDPRAILASRLKLGLDGVNKTTAGKEAKTLCDRYRSDLNYQDKISQEKLRMNSEMRKHNAILDGRYLRIRFEDFAVDPLETARNIYRFIDNDLPPEVEDRIKHSQYKTNEIFRILKQKQKRGVKTQADHVLENMLDPFGTQRDPTQVLHNWRWSLSFDIVQTAQEECEDVMKTLRYNFFHSPPEMLNFSVSPYQKGS